MAVLAAALLVFFLQGAWSSPLEVGGSIGGGRGVAGGANFGVRVGGDTKLNAELAAGAEGVSGIGTSHGVGNTGVKANVEIDGSTSGGNMEANLGDLSASTGLSGGQTGILNGDGAVSSTGLELNLDPSAYMSILTALLGVGPQGILNMGLNGNAAGTGLSLTPGVGVNMDYSGYRLGDLTAAGINAGGNMAKLPFSMAGNFFNGLRSGIGLTAGGVGLDTSVKVPSLQTSVGIPGVGMSVGVPRLGMNFGVPGVGMNFGVPGVGMNLAVPEVGVKFGGSGGSSGHLGGVRSILPSFSFNAGSNTAPTNPK